MKLSAPFLILFAAVGIVHASAHDGRSRIARHADVAHHKVVRRGDGNGRCKVRPTSSSLVASSSHSPASSSTHKPTKAAVKETKPTELASSDEKNHDSGSKSNSNAGKFVDGLIKITDSSCGPPNACHTPSATCGPNGNIDWFNCGIDNGGWKPPKITVQDIVTVDLQEALNDPGSPFGACKPFVQTFVKYANEFGVPPILIASIAMQESSCNPATVGGAGEQGLMQITKEKCKGAPGGDCKEPDFNIRTGTAFFSNLLKNNGGSLLQAIGSYNGWFQGLTIQSATAAANGNCCTCQNNLDYLQQVMNHWVMNRDPYKNRVGKYFNLDKCY